MSRKSYVFSRLADTICLMWVEICKIVKGTDKFPGGRIDIQA